MTSFNSAEIRSDAIYLNGRHIDAGPNPKEQLEYVLATLGRDAIVAAIESSYASRSRQNPDADVVRPSVFAMRLGSDETAVLTELGRYNRTRIHRSPFEIQPQVLELSDIIAEHGFRPEIRSNLGARATRFSALYLRNPETDPAPITPLDALPAAFGFVEPGEIRHLRPQLRQAHAEQDADTLVRLWISVAEENEGAIDKQRKTFEVLGADLWRGAEALARVGRGIAEAILRVEILGDVYLLGQDRYEEALFDAHDHIRELAHDKYPYSIEIDAVDVELKHEVDRVRSLRC